MFVQFYKHAMANQDSIIRRAKRICEHSEIASRYTAVAYRLLSNTDEIPTSYNNYDNLTKTDIQKAESIVRKALHNYELLIFCIIVSMIYCLTFEIIIRLSTSK